MRSIIKDAFTIIRNDGNTKLIISSHGGQLKKTFQTPVTLKFLSVQNYSAYGAVTKIPVMAEKEFETEPAGTGGLTDYKLANFEDDHYTSFLEVLGQGYDVVTIQRRKHVNLTTVLKSPEIHLFGYTEVYCLFCRVPMQAQYVKVMF